ncbi:hypothetical protein ABBQ38_010394 [Trebouxia sp. C0009 RCD-2024]
MSGGSHSSTPPSHPVPTSTRHIVQVEAGGIGLGSASKGCSQWAPHAGIGGPGAHRSVRKPWQTLSPRPLPQTPLLKPPCSWSSAHDKIGGISKPGKWRAEGARAEGYQAQADRLQAAGLHPAHHQVEALFSLANVQSPRTHHSTPGPGAEDGRHGGDRDCPPRAVATAPVGIASSGHG